MLEGQEDVFFYLTVSNETTIILLHLRTLQKVS